MQIVDLLILSISEICNQIREILKLPSDSKIVLKIFEATINQFVKLENLAQLNQEHIILKVFSDYQFLLKTSWYKI